MMRNNLKRIQEAFMLFSEDVQNRILCSICQNPYNLTTRAPWNICRNFHNVCLSCKTAYLSRSNTCHTCRVVINPQNVIEDRSLKFTIERQVRRVNGGQNILLDIEPQPSLIINMSSNNSLVQPLLPPNPPQNRNVAQNIVNNRNRHQIQPQNIAQHQSVQNNQTIDEVRYKKIKKQYIYFNLIFLITFQTPFMICNFIYAYNCDPTPSIDDDYGVGMTIRDWLYSSAYWGLVMHIYMVIMCLFIIDKKINYIKARVFLIFYIVFGIIMVLKNYGYNFILTILWGKVPTQVAKDLDLSIYQYLVWFMIIYWLGMIQLGWGHLVVIQIFK